MKELKPYSDLPKPTSLKKDNTSSIAPEIETLQNADNELDTAKERIAELEAINKQLQREIDEHQRLEVQLRKREQELSDFFENGAIGLHWLRPDGTILWANQAELDLLGYTRQEYIGHHIAEFYVEREVVEDILQKLTAQETLHDYEAKLRCKDGSIKNVSIDSNAFYKDDQFIHTRCFTHDITTRKRGEKQLRARERQQAAVAQLGQQALAGTNLSLLMNEAVVLVAQALEVEYSKILELLPDGNAFLLRAGVGWQAGLVGQGTVEAGIDSQAGYTLFSSKPVMVEDLRTEFRFSGPPLLHEHGVVSALSVIIPGQNRPYGVFGIYTTSCRTFSQDDVHFLQSIANVLATVIERKQAEALLMEQSRLAALDADIGISLTRSNTLPDILKQCAEALVRHLDAAFARIWTLNSQENVLELQASAGMYTHINGAHSRIPVGQFKIGLIAQERQPHLTNNVIGDPRIHAQAWAIREGIVAFAGYPLTLEEQLVGVMAMFSRQPLPENTLKAMASVANNLSLGIQRKQSETALKQAHNELEIRVRERTQELAKANEELQKEIAERKQVESSLRESQRQLATLIDSLPGIVFSCANDAEWSMRYLSEGCLNLTGYTSEELVSNESTSYNAITHPEDLPKILATIDAAIAQKQSYVVEYRICTKFNQEKWLWEKGRGVFDSNGEVLSLEGFITDITDRKQAEARLLHDALHDPLTGLPNRTLFMDRLGHAIHLAQRYSEFSFAVLFLDLDRFKVINDSLGHVAGDQLLISVAQKLKAQLRVGDTVARLGGDEFVILLENIYDLSDATSAADRIQHHLTCPFNLNGHEVFTSASIGIALSNGVNEQPESFLRDADIAMYRAKSLGKARYAIFSSGMHEQAWSRLRLETSLRRAIERQELQLYYQPIVLLASGKIVGFEALVRWQHSEQGLLLPEAFISVAEETGLIIPLGHWVLHEACRQLRQWQTYYSTRSSTETLPLTVSVNISGRQFGQPNLIEHIQQVLQATGLEARSLKLEITESVLMDNAETATAILLQLKALGIQLHMDDFGTGYSSLSYLHRFPVDTLKIDRSFISRMGINEDNDIEGISIVQTIVTLAQNLGIGVTAEGIETAEQLAQLKELKCTCGQGYFFFPPLDSKSAEALIED